MNWQWLGFDRLEPVQLYAVLQLRQRVFVVEQDCPFLDADDLDADAQHLLGHDEQGQLLAYLRLHASGRRRPEAVISRVVTAPEARGRGLGLALMSEACRQLRRSEPGGGAWLGAQQRLEAFYRRFGFEVCSPPYLEDDIWHVGMQARVADLQVVARA